MHFLIWIAIGLAALLLICLLVALICFLLVFYSPKSKLPEGENYEIPEGEIYEVFREDIKNWIMWIRQLPQTQIEIKSDDGLTLRGTYYEYKPGAPIEILFHGYRGYAERDLNGGVERCFSLGRSALLVDQRASGKSDGRVVTFGIKECRDCIRWIEEVSRRFGEEQEIIITGISMGAATVMMASGESDLPPNVVCCLADCGYTSAREILQKVLREMKLPVWLFYPFIKLGARLFGGFSLESNSPMEAVKRSKVPMIFVHGDCDAFVPCEMSEQLYEACSSEIKDLHFVKDAGHGLAFPVERDAYIASLAEFEKVWRK
ncbi:MAG: alpha/beta hydrolase [Clostridia bacterium]|nr:alpha/beta hydrolase [Clostridia bacterium]